MPDDGLILRIDELVTEPKYVELFGERYPLLHPADADPIQLARAEKLRTAFLEGASQAFADSYEFAETVCGLVAPSVPPASIRRLRPWQAFELAQRLLTFWNEELEQVQRRGGQPEEEEAEAGPPISVSSSPGSSGSMGDRRTTG